MNGDKRSSRGRPPESGNVRLQPIFRKEPDIQKLGRAIIAIATSAAKLETDKKTGEEYEEQE